jgi:hypothetical protein
MSKGYEEKDGSFLFRAISICPYLRCLAPLPWEACGAVPLGSMMSHS